MGITELWSLIISVLLGLFMMFFKTHLRADEAFKRLARQDIDNLRINYVHKQDMKDLKQELMRDMKELKTDLSHRFDTIEAMLRDKK